MLALLLAAVVAAIPIPQGGTGKPPAFVGHPATPNALRPPPPPQHPQMAPNGDSLLHEDAWQTDASWRAGPLGNNVQTVSTFFSRDCASVTFDSRGRIVTVCVGLDRPVAEILDPKTLDTIASLDLPPRDASVGNPFQSFGGGGYFYLDARDQAIVPTTTRHVYVIKAGASALTLSHDYDLSGTVPSGDSIISALPDWHGKVLWFASRKGVFGTVNIATGAIKATHLEPIGNSFAVGEEGGAYVVTDGGMYRFALGADGTPVQKWRRVYDNTGTQKPGQTQPGSGTTPTLMARNLVSITDNADPMDIVVYTRGGRQVCKQPVFAKGASDSDQSLIAVGRSMIAENNYGYSGPTAVENGATTTPGLERVDVNRTLTGCRVIWKSDEIAPSVVPKVSIPNGLVYTYTKPADPSDPWYLTALDFRTGKTVYKALAGTGLGFNNNYAPVSIGRDGTAYVGTLGGLVGLRDATPPAQPKLPLKPHLRIRACRTIAGRDADWVRSARFKHLAHGRVRATITLTDFRVVHRLARGCGSTSNKHPRGPGA